MSNLTSEGEQVMQLITELVQAWNAHDPDRVAALYASDYLGTDVSEAHPQRGPQGVRQTVARYLCAFPDVEVVPEETIIQGERVAIVSTVKGTHQGKLMNIPATGRLAVIRGVSIFTVRDGKIAQAQYIWDVAGFLRSIGLLPEL
jgi:steroid delta-isomerase-like uncharacterized protein